MKSKFDKDINSIKGNSNTNNNNNTISTIDSNNNSNRNIRIKSYNSLDEIVSNPTYTVKYLGNPLQSNNNDTSTNTSTKYYINKSLIMTRVSKILNEFHEYNSEVDNNIIGEIDIESNDNEDNNTINDKESNNNDNNNDNVTFTSHNNNTDTNNNINSILKECVSKTVKYIFSYSNRTLLALLIGLSTIAVILFANVIGISSKTIFISFFIILSFIGLLIILTIRYQLMTSSYTAISDS